MADEVIWNDKLRARIEKRLEAGEGGCLLWTGSMSNKTPALTVQKRTRTLRALLWERDRGPIPEGHLVARTCDNPRCVALDHLEVTTQSALRTRAAPSGKTHHARRFTDEEEQQLVARVQAGESQASVAREVGVTRAGMSKIVKKWRG